MRSSQDENSQARGSRVVNQDGATAPTGSESGKRVVDLLLAFTKERHTMSAKELARATRIPLPSVYRYVALLRDAGLLVADNQHTYHLSTRFTALARAAEAAEGIIALAHPTMQRLAERTGETVLLSRLINGAAVCIHRIESSQRLRFSFDPGEPFPVERGATTRILLASLPEARRAEILDELRTRNPARADLLARDIALAGQQGCATAAEEVDQGIWAVSAAVYGDEGEIRAALTLTAPIVRTPAPMRENLLGLVRTAAGEISTLLLRPASSAR